MLKLLPWIEERRSETDKRQDDIAKELGLTQAQVSRILSGETALRVEIYIRLSQIIGFDAAEGIRVAAA